MNARYIAIILALLLLIPASFAASDMIKAGVIEVNATGLRVLGYGNYTSNIYTPTLCLNGVCQSSWSAGSGVTGLGVQGYLPLWNTTATINSSVVYQSGGNLGVGTTGPTQRLDVNGSINVSGSVCLGGTCKSSWPAVNGNITGAGTTNTLSYWTNGTNLGDSSITQSGTDITVGGALTVSSASADSSFNTQQLFIPANIWLGGDPNRVGINTVSPKAGLDVNGGFRVGNDTSGRTDLFVNHTTGYTGLGTASPASLLEVASSSGATINISATTAFGTTNLAFAGRGTGGTADFWRLGTSIDGSKTDFSLNYDTGGIVPVAVTTAGFVGINTTAPTYTLDVAGQVRINMTGNNAGLMVGTPAFVATDNALIYAQSNAKSPQLALAYTSNSNGITGATFAVDSNGNLTISTNQCTGACGGRNLILGPVTGGGYTVATAGDMLVTGGLTLNNKVLNIPNNLSADTGLLFIDSLNNRVGINTTTPITQLHVPGMPPVMIANMTNVPYTRFLTIQGRYLYTVSDNSTSPFNNALYIYDVSDPRAPVMVGNVSVVGRALDVKVQGQYAYVPLFQNPVQIIDVSNPARPFIAGNFTPTTLPTRIQIEGRYAYVSGQTPYNLFVYDISNATTPQYVTTFNFTGTNIVEIQVRGRYIFTSSAGASPTFQVFDAQNIRNISSISNTTLTFTTNELAVQGRYAYISSTAVVAAVDLSNLSNPVVTNMTALGPGGGHIVAQGRYIYFTTSSTYNRTIIADVSNISNPLVLGNVSTPSGQLGLAVQGRYLFVNNIHPSNIGGFYAFDLGGAYIQSLEAGSAEVGSLAVRQGIQAVDGTFEGSVTVGGSVLAQGDIATSENGYVGGILTLGDYIKNMTVDGTTWRIYGKRYGIGDNNVSFFTMTGESSSRFGMSSPGGAYVYINRNLTSQDSFQILNGSAQNLFKADYNGAISIGTGAANNATGTGDLYVTSDIEYDGNLYGPGADVAELINSSEALAPGDVVVADDVKAETIKRSTKPYDTTVVGIVSTDPSYIMSKKHGDVPLALTGRVPVKVSAENGAIKPGDLLTTSGTPGYAMKCASRQECQGAIVAKSLGTLNEGKGTITGLVMLG